MPSMDPFLVVVDRCPQLAPRLKKKYVKFNDYSDFWLLERFKLVSLSPFQEAQRVNKQGNFGAFVEAPKI